MITKTCTKCLVAKPLSSFNKLSKAKDGLQYHCKECKLAYQRSNPKRSEVSKRYYEANRVACIERSIKSQQKKPEYYASKMREWSAANREKHLATRRAYYARNSAKDIERVRRRASRVKNVDHLNQAEKAEIQAMYDFCKIFPGFEVDHIVPLNGRTVSGLHVPANLQVLPIFENRSKGNKFKE